MNIPPQDDLDQMAAELRRLIEREWTPERIRVQLDPGAALDRDGWQLLAEQGCAAALVTEEHGGLDAGLTTAGVFATELGRRLVPVPFLATTLATAALSAVPVAPAADEWLSQLADGSRIGTVALTGVSGHPVTAPGVEAVRSGEGWVLSGTAGFAPHGTDADVVVIAVGAPESMLVVVPLPSDGVQVVPRLMHDRTQPMADVVLSGARLPDSAVLAAGVDAEHARQQVLLSAAVLRAADAAGGVRAVLDVAVAYAKERRQFDRPIGSFQAVKHKLANMHVRAEGAAAAARGAARGLDAGRPDAVRRAALAASYALEAYVSVAGDAIQVLGGMGYTWEHDCHMYFKRAQLDEALFGDAAWLRALAAEEIFTSQSA